MSEFIGECALKGTKTESFLVNPTYFVVALESKETDLFLDLLVVKERHKKPIELCNPENFFF